MPEIQCQQQRIESLRQQMARWEGASRRGPSTLGRAPAERDPSERRPVVSSGCPALDRVLPENGFRVGTLVEWIGRGEGSGAATLALRAAAAACCGSDVLVGGASVGAGPVGGASVGGTLVVLDRRGK